MSGIQNNPFAHLSSSGIPMPTLGGLATISLQNPVLASSATKAASSWISSISNSLRHYFDVTNLYVLKKFQLILIPFINRGNWKEFYDQYGEVGSPKENLYAPDLYIPLMSFITFVLLAGLAQGYRGTFSPEYLGMAASSGVIILVLQILVASGGFYFLQVGVPSVVDLVAYFGYKFVVCVMAQIGSLLLGDWFYYPIFGYCGLMFVVFLVKSLQRYIDSYDYMDALKVAKQSFLYILGAIQFPVIFFLGFY